jgi:large subunit ribosomal protein L37Ae
LGRTYKVGVSGSLGARYGTVARKRYASVVTGMRAPHECPQCHLSAVRRMSVGIWHCGRCGYKFAGGAYAPRTKLGEIAERATHTAVAPSLVSGLKATAEPQVGAKATARRRRKKAEDKKLTESAGTAETPEATTT